VENQRIVGEKHLKLKLRKSISNTSYDAILFFQAEPLPEYIQAVFRLQANEFNGNTTLQLLIEHWSDNSNKIKND
jgi:single-stranded-DNA-specific exonuclease